MTECTVYSRIGRSALPVVLTALLLVPIACRQSVSESPTAEISLADRAAALAREALIIDSHIDFPIRLLEEQVDVSVRNQDGHFDLPRARQGGLDAAFMAIYVSARLQGTGQEKQRADDLIDLVTGMAERWPDRLRVVRTPEELRASFSEGLLALPLGIENAAAIEDDLANLQHFHQRGVRYLTLAHSRANQICDSSYDEERLWNGLSPFGRQVVTEMNRLGLMIDVSHVSDDTFFQILELSQAPVVATHSCCRHFTPGFERNLSDEMITRLAGNGGVVQVAFGSAFLTATNQQQSAEAWATVGRYLEEHGLDWDSPEVKTELQRYWQEHPPAPTDVGTVVDHLEHVIELAGIDHVGFGSDFDGVGQLPAGLEDVSGYPRIIEELLRRGYGEPEIRKICGENLLRLWSEVERIAAELQQSEGAR